MSQTVHTSGKIILNFHSTEALIAITEALKGSEVAVDVVSAMPEPKKEAVKKEAVKKESAKKEKPAKITQMPKKTVAETVTLTDIRELAIPLNKEDVRAVFAQFGATKLPEINKKDYPKVFKALKALEAKKV